MALGRRILEIAKQAFSNADVSGTKLLLIGVGTVTIKILHVAIL